MNMDNEFSPEIQENSAHVQTAIDHLAEKYDVVVLIMSRYDRMEDKTKYAYAVHGNSFAVPAMVDKFWEDNYGDDDPMCGDCDE